ncbi:HEPN domain-containing protein [Aeromonas veronii]|uniref:HEPN domain-containing protein n=1 Tax=Aeromonas veronii TaxID=654 RepID=UPI003B9E7492
MIIDGAKNIEKLYNEFTENHKYLMDSLQVSFANDYKSQFSKIIVLSTASYFESKITELIKEQLNPSNCEITGAFIYNKGLVRQYHSLFDWDAQNANKFFSLFGMDFKCHIEKLVANDPTLKSSIQSFLFIGSLRNKLVHQNYVTFQVDTTTEEVFNKFKLANENFVEKLPEIMSDYRNIKTPKKKVEV